MSDGDDPSGRTAVEATDVETDTDAEVQRDMEVDSEGSDGLSDNENNNDDGDGLVKMQRKKKDRAPVWSCGGEKIEGGGKCKLCGKLFKSENFNTSNITDHIIKKHARTAEGKRLKVLRQDKRKETVLKKETKRLKKKEKNKFQQSSMMNFVKKGGVIDPLRKKKIEDAVINLIVVENEALQLVEKHNFRELLHVLEPGYICSSRRTYTKKIKELNKKTKVDLKNDIAKDLEEVPNQVVNITSDHGTSKDRFHTHKNVLTLSRCTKDFVIKTDTVDVIKCEGSQNGRVIRTDVRDKLDEAGRTPQWIINWTTDGEAKQINARARGKHQDVGMETWHTASCVDHTAHLAAEETLEMDECFEIKFSTDKAHTFVEKQKQSNLQAEAFNKVMRDAGDDPLTTTLGTRNRWYFKWVEMSRVLLLKQHIVTFQENYEGGLVDNVLLDEDFHNISIYVSSLKTLSDASDLLEGETYPTASSVIPFLDQVFTSLTTLIEKLQPADKAFPTMLLQNLQNPRRFPNGYKTETPFNCLTLLTPRYMDIYFDEAELDKAISDIINDVVYQNLPVQQISEPPPIPSSSAAAHPSNPFELRRAQLLARKQVPQEIPVDRGVTHKEKIKAEINTFLSLRGTVEYNSNPQSWWREHAAEYPLLARFYRAHCAFQATSTASERVFNVEGLVFTPFRKMLDPELGNDLIRTRDFIKKRLNQDSYRLCQKCPQPPSSSASYIISCPEHNKN